MKTTGIICEYNPFHTGHKYQIDYARKSGAECIVCVLSGNFTQRGEIAIADKYTRAKAALAEGADAVVELPFPYCSMSAEGFANAGVYILSHMGADTICFGCEAENQKVLYDACDKLESENFIGLLKENTDKNKGTASLFFEKLGNGSEYPQNFGSNDILGIAYIQACRRFCPSMNIFPLKRSGNEYLSTDFEKSGFPSAAALRKKIYINKSFSDISNSLIPKNALKVFTDAQNSGIAPVSDEKISHSVLSFFKLLTPDEIEQRAINLSQGGKTVADNGCGIVNRLCRIADKSTTYEQFISEAYNSKYTNSRLRRVILFSLCGVSDAMYRFLPIYTTLLAANQKGCRLLASIRKNNKIKVVTKPADAPFDTSQYRLSGNADKLFSMAMPSAQDSGFFIRSSPSVITDEKHKNL